MQLPSQGRGSIDDIYSSTWASRAWNFQEAHLAKMRLYFTETGVIYICEIDVQVDFPPESFLPRHMRHDLGVMARTLPRNNLRLGAAMKMLEEYTRRQLTFESDALNAIVGALNTLVAEDRNCATMATREASPPQSRVAKLVASWLD